MMSRWFHSIVQLFLLQQKCSTILDCHNLGVSEYDNYVSTAGESGLVVGFVYEISGENATSIRIGLFIGYTIMQDSYQITYRVSERPSTSRYFQSAVEENSFDAFKKALIHWLEED